MTLRYVKGSPFLPLKSVQLFVVKHKMLSPLVPLIQYAEEKLLLTEAILHIHNKTSQHIHASAAACQFDCLSVRLSPNGTEQQTKHRNNEGVLCPNWSVNTDKVRCIWIIYS